LAIDELPLAWNEYDQHVLLAASEHLTVAAAMDAMFATDAPLWNCLMAIAFHLFAPPIAVHCFVLRRGLVAEPGMGEITGRGRLRQRSAGAICAPRAGPIVAHRPECSSAW
jgi:ABC-type glycerol-3-phosphate transport system permease component